MKFLAITASNLDEFFMVRVGGLRLLVEQGITTPDPAGMTPAEQLAAVSKRAHEMVDQQQACFLELEQKLAEAGIRRVRGQELTERRAKAVEQVFESEIFSVMTPRAVRSGEDFPLLVNQMLHVAVHLAPDGTSDGQPRLAIIPLGRSLPRFFTLIGRGAGIFVCAAGRCGRADGASLFSRRESAGERGVSDHAERRFFAPRRSGDRSARGMEGILTARKHGRLRAAGSGGRCERESAGELDGGAGGRRRRRFFKRPRRSIWRRSCRSTDLAGFEALKYEPWPPQPSPDVEHGTKMFDIIAHRDVLLYHPYESFDPVLRLIEEAAADPDVLAIKQILYRTSRNSPIVAALARAAQRGKYVTVIVELKARFDEARNIEWARSLEETGRASDLRREGAEDARQDLHHRSPRAARRRALRAFWHRQLQRDHGPDL